MRAHSRGRHAAGTVWWARWWALGGAVALVGGGTAGLVLAVTAGPSATQVKAHKAEVAHQAAVTQATLVAQLLSYLSVSPASGASGVALNAPVVVATSRGTLTSVRVTDATGAVLTGSWSAAHNKWLSRNPLQPGATYKIKAVVAGAGVTAQKSSSFTTLVPTAPVNATVFPTSGMTVGVGEPIVIRFDHYIHSTADQAAVLSHFRVSESKPVPGGWYWFSLTELHLRPETYWPSGEKITITGDLDGWDAGDGRWGQGQLSSTFSIGDARISVANLQSELMTVTLNGAVIATYPISGGRPKYPTMGGTHIVLDREPVVHMISSSVGIPVNSPDGYDEKVYEDVHISDSGEYVHSAPWSVGSQGFTNVSHGCINLSPNHATSFYYFSRVGDVVQVVGSPRPPAYGDHGVMDWTTPWSDWTPAAVHSSSPPVTTTVAPTTTAVPATVAPAAGTTATSTTGTSNAPAQSAVKPTVTTTTTVP